MNKYLPILIFFILADVVGDNLILQVFGTRPATSALLLSTIFLVLQMLAAPIQAGFSDFYCRKKSLIVALSCSCLALILLFFTKSQSIYSLILLIIVLIIKGGFGNTVPLSWSALADTQEKNLRFSLALSTGAYAIGYMALAILNIHSPNHLATQRWLSANTMPILLFLISIALCTLFFRDVRDKQKNNSHQNTRLVYLNLAHSEFISLLKDFRRQSTRLGLLAYLLWATSQYSILILLADFQTDYTSTVIMMMCGYLIGIGILGICKKIRDEKMIKTAFIITIASISCFFASYPFMNSHYIALSLCYFFYTIGNAFLSPSILSLFSKERGVYEQGKGFGLIISADSGGFLVGSIAVIIFNTLKLDMIYMILFSFITFLLSWLPYAKYEKTRKDIRSTVKPA